MDPILAASYFSSNLTQLYTEAKKSALSNVRKEDATPALTTLHRKLRIQKDRLVTWGLEWSDETTGQDGNIDQSVARAGLTETVTSVLGNIKEVLEQADQIRSSRLASPNAVRPSKPVLEKASWHVVDQSKYDDLIKDLTTSIDILYDLSHSRRALAQESRSTHSPDDLGTEKIKSKVDSHLVRSPSFASSELTLVNPPSFTRPSLSPYAGLPPIIDTSALILPDEEPPPYQSFGSPAVTRMIGTLLRARASDSVRLRGSSGDLPVLVEYANFEAAYRDTGVPPPLQRLEQLCTVLQKARSQQDLYLLGYFEDSVQPRIGLVYDFLGSMHGGVVAEMGLKPVGLTAVSLLQTLQAASKTAKLAASDNVAATPPLEQRLRLALRVVEKLQDLHFEAFPHGNITSSSIAFITAKPGRPIRSCELRSVVVSAFDIFPDWRAERPNGPSSLNLYKHPKDNGRSSEPVTNIAYETYSLGLVLLEIGLWTPLSDLYKPKYTLADFKLRLEKIWIPRLAAKCGSLYMRVVQSCIRASEDDIGNLDMQRCWDSIMPVLRRCCLLDEDEPFQKDAAALTAAAVSAGSGTESTPTQPRRHHVSPFSDADHQRLMSASKAQDSTASPPPNRASSMASHARFTSAMPLAHAGFPGLAHWETETTLRQEDRTDSRPSSSIDMNRAESLSLRQGSSPATYTSKQAWHGRHDFYDCPFREYRRKVMLIQNQWRNRPLRTPGQTRTTGSQASSRELHRTATENVVALPQQLSTARTSSDMEGYSRRAAKPRIFPVKLAQEVIDNWHSDLGLRLSRIVERALKDSPETSAIDLVGLGHDALSARATILITCTSTARVKAAIKRKFDFDRAVFDLKIEKGRVRLCRGKARKESGGCFATRAGANGDANESNDTPPQNPFWQQRPLCGASIGAFLPDYGHLHPVSLGGIVLVDDKPYGLSVHHMLEPPSEDESEIGDNESDDHASSEAVRSSARGPRNIRRSSRQLSSFTIPAATRAEPHDVGFISDIATSDKDDEEYPSSEFESDASEDEATQSSLSNLPEPGDTEGVQFDDDDESDIVITQPALEDAVSQNLHAEDIPQEDLDEDHLLSYKLGKIYASSGLRRWQRNGVRHEIDWALVQLDPPRLQPYNLVQGGRRYCKSAPASCPRLEDPICRQAGHFSAAEDLYPCAIAASSALASRDVHSFGRTSGLRGGTTAAAMSFVKIYGRRTFSSSWTVVGDFGVGGDSGSWIIDNATSAVCGHVLAERNGVTYFCPMQLLLSDIKRTLGAATVALPGGADVDAGVEEDVNAVAGVGAGIDADADAGARADTVADASVDVTSPGTQERALAGVVGAVGLLALGDRDQDGAGSAVPVANPSRVRKKGCGGQHRRALGRSQAIPS